VSEFRLSIDDFLLFVCEWPPKAIRPEGELLLELVLIELFRFMHAWTLIFQAPFAYLMDPFP